MYREGQRGSEQQDAGRGTRQKQASDPPETGVHAGPPLLLLQPCPALVQQVAAVSGFSVAACFFFFGFFSLKPSCWHPFSHLNVSFC